MTKSSFILTLSQITSIQLEEPSAQQSFSLPTCKLRWRSNQLWIRAASNDQATLVPAVQNEQWITQCLTHSSVRVLCLDAGLGVSALCQWADLARRAKKRAFIRLPTYLKPQIIQISSSLLQRLVNSFVAATLLVVLLPVMAVLLLLLRLESTEVLEKPWAVGRQGELFRLWRFFTYCAHSAEVDAEGGRVQRLLYKTELYRLPELINVVRGEIPLMGEASLLVVMLTKYGF